MKMVSQLTRQAMSRHRLISAAPYPPAAISSPPEQPPQPQSVRPLYSAPPQPVEAPPPAPVQPSGAISAPVPSAPAHNQRTIYGQLMKKHDRFTERHLVRS